MIKKEVETKVEGLNNAFIIDDIDGKVNISNIVLNGKSIKLLNTYHLVFHYSDKEYFYNPIMDYLGKKIYYSGIKKIQPDENSIKQQAHSTAKYFVGNFSSITL